MSKQKAYIYPYLKPIAGGGFINPYIQNFVSSLEAYIHFVNVAKYSKVGLFNLVKYIFKIDFIFLNWIESLPAKKGGKLQTLFFLFIIPFLRLFKIKICWTLHNKIAHSKDHYKIKKYLYIKMLKISDFVLTHSSEGVSFAKELMPDIDSNKIIYLPHPVIDRTTSEHKDYKYDIIMWGKLIPHKGIDKFLDFLIKEGKISDYNILVAGRATNATYGEKLESYNSSNVTVINKYIPQDELDELISTSKVTLFSYKEESVLSSGVLMDAIGYGSIVLGPNIAAFKDLADIGVIYTYKSYSELIIILDKILKQTDSRSKEQLDVFIKENTWDVFAQKYYNVLTL